jgi:hydrogenase nickel incorporation protein HypB
MCATCGCSDDARIIDEAASHPHSHDHGHPSSRTVLLEQKVLARNDEQAAKNRSWLAERDLLAVNLMSSPGSGKTTLLERTIRDLSGRVEVSVVEGDQETTFDAERIRATGCRVVQINTGAGCHLDADMLARALRTLDPPPSSVVFVENVGNLVCPALFDLGESARVVVMSVTEGADKPLKYPHMFRTADVLLLNKTDLLPYVEFDVSRFREYLNKVNERAQVVQVSAARGDGIHDWYGWLRERIRACVASLNG